MKREEEKEEKEKNTKVQITKRDLVLLRDINSFGYVDISFICQKFGLKPNVAYRRLRRLMAAKVVRHFFVYHQKPGIYLVTAKGVQLCNDELPPLYKVSLGEYEHNLAVSKASLALANRFQAKVITERQIRHALHQKGVGQYGHIADAALDMNGKKIALEVELSQKGSERLKKILDQYSLQIEYDEVLYLCGNANLFNRFKALESQYSFLKAHLLKDVLNAR